MNRLRRELLQAVHGEILEVGIGTGLNLPLYPATDHITGIDIGMERLTGAANRAAVLRAKQLISLSQADAQQLPFAGNRFDTVVGTLVFCSIPRPELALSEIRRVLRPSGRLLLLEHVRGKGPISRRLTDWLHPLWFALQGECHLNRETAATVRDTGFHIDHISPHGWGILQLINATPQ